MYNNKQYQTANCPILWSDFYQCLLHGFNGEVYAKVLENKKHYITESSFKKIILGNYYFIKRKCFGEFNSFYVHIETPPSYS